MPVFYIIGIKFAILIIRMVIPNHFTRTCTKYLEREFSVKLNIKGNYINHRSSSIAISHFCYDPQVVSKFTYTSREVNFHCVLYMFKQSNCIVCIISSFVISLIGKQLLLMEVVREKSTYTSYGHEPIRE